MPNIAKCKRCGEPAKVEVARANASFCADCFLRFVRGQVAKAIDEQNMMSPGDRVLVGVSGGKDSLALWDILLELGYETTGYHITLWTGEEYAKESRQMCEDFASQRGLKLIITDLAEDEGFTIERITKQSSRAPCSMCGLTKRYLANLEAVRGGYDVVATGHNLDDEAATLLGNTLHWQTEYLSRQAPVLQSTHANLAKKVKPLYRLSERDMAAYSILRGIDYIVEECPLVAGNTGLKYKDVLNELERTSPGTKQQFLFGFLENAAGSFDDGPPVELHECTNCSMPTPGDVCAYCRAKQQLARTDARKSRT